MSIFKTLIFCSRDSRALFPRMSVPGNSHIPGDIPVPGFLSATLHHTLSFSLSLYMSISYKILLLISYTFLTYVYSTPAQTMVSSVHASGQMIICAWTLSCIWGSWFNPLLDPKCCVNLFISVFNILKFLLQGAEDGSKSQQRHFNRAMAMRSIKMGINPRLRKGASS